ncbi:MAG TPA: anthranilate synthase component I [Alphaproteobacteria bacterium]|jgi:anthranilate synthase
MSIDNFRTASGFRIRRRTTRLDYAAGFGFLAEQLDSRRGAYFSSGVEDPDRYSRWEFGFADPPLEIVGRGRALTLGALNRRGEVLLALLAPVLAGGGVSVVRRGCARVELGVARAARRFPEEERSRQPSAFTVLRRIAGAFAGTTDRFLGLYGAFGYDLVFQFEDLPQRLARAADAVDLHLYLPDRLYVLDRRLETAHRYDYDFARGSLSTAGLPRASAHDAAPRYSAAAAAPAIAADVGAVDYAQAVETVRRHLAAGDAFEVVLSRTFSSPCAAAPSRLFAALRQVSPSPYEFLIRLGADEALLGASPEMFVRVDADGRNGRRIETCPISGTIRRAGEPMEDAERIRALLNSEKDEAELTMCTDVDRNDKARICAPGSVRLLARRLIERYAGLFHTVDHVEGRLRPGFDGFDAFLSHMWAVTLTGAPKRKAVEIIEALEIAPRRWYGGAIGGFTFDGGVNTGITIRTIHLEAGIARYRAGASIVYDSKGDEEAAETETKATAFRRVLAALTQVRPRAAAAPAASSAARPGAGRRVIMIDNEDSFVHTLADYFRQTGAAVTTYRWGLPLADVLAARPDLVVHSPGPGRPAEFGVPALVRALAAEGIPQFGVCLGLQGIAEAFGGTLAVLPEPRHGKRWHVLHEGAGLFRDLPSPLAVGAYHSLHAPAQALPAELAVTGRTEAGLVMALRHKHLPIAAVQFHPESILSLGGGYGLALIANAVASLAPRAPAAFQRSATMKMRRKGNSVRPSGSGG